MSSIDWVRSLKVGDEVAVRMGRSFGIYKVTEVASRKNAASKVVRVSDVWYDRVGSRGDVWHRTHIEPVTDAIRAAIAWDAAVNRLLLAKDRLCDAASRVRDGERKPIGPAHTNLNLAIASINDAIKHLGAAHE